MGLIDQMKYAKILYLTDVLEDIQDEMNRDYRCHSYAESISGIVKDLRETVAVTSMPNEMECEKIKIARLETAYKADMFVPAENRKEYEASIRRRVESDIISKIKYDKLIRIRRIEDEYNVPTFTASLIVGIEKQPYVPQEQPLTPVDGLAKMLDEIDKNTNL